MATTATTYFDGVRRPNVAHSATVRTVWLTCALVVLASSRVPAQSVERPIGFDSAGRVMVITPELARRFALDSTHWPVGDDFRDARLYATAPGMAVLAVRRADESVTRYELDEAARERLRAAIQAATVRRGIVVSEEGGDVVVESAARGFVRHQKLVAATLYAPAAAALVGGQSGAGATYAIVAGGSYFALNEMVERVHITRAQADLANDGAWRGASMAVMSLYAANAGDSRTYSAGIIAGGIAGTVAGYRRGRAFTDAEAAAAAGASTMLGLTSAGLLGAAGLFDSVATLRPAMLPIMAAMGLGWGIGPSYPRRATYGVTSSDVGLVRMSSWLGAAAALTPMLASDDVDGHLASGVATAGLVVGALVGDRAFARPVDHSRADYRSILLAVGAGSTLFGAIPALAQSGNAALTLGAWTAGAVFGASYAERKIRARLARGLPPSGAGGTAAHARHPAAERDARVQLHFSPTSAMAAAAGSRGTHRILQVTF